MMIRAEQLQADDAPQEQRQLLKRRATHAVHVGVLGNGITAYFERESSAAQLRKRYRSLFCDRGTMQAHIASDDRDITHFLHGEAGYVWPYGALTDRGTAFLADAVITDALLRSIPQAVTLHAAALRYGDAAFAITGVSTAGKTTTAIACVAAGCALYSDERCIVTGGGVVAYPRTLNVRSGSLDLLRLHLPRHGIRRRLRRYGGGQWRDASFDELFGSPVAPEPAPLRALFSIRGYASTPATRRISAVEMLRDAELGAKTQTRGVDRVRVLLEILSGIACFELVLGTPFQSALHVVRLLEGLSA